METFVLLIFFGLQAKHLAADYLLQPSWMIAGKSSFTSVGGYAHVCVHALGTLVVLLFSGASFNLMAALLAGEAVAHYLIDFAKARWTRSRSDAVTSRAFWAAHGTDQFMHQLTYAVMVFILMHNAIAAA